MYHPDLLPNLKELEGVSLCHLRDFLKKEIETRKGQLDLVYDELIRRYVESTK